MSPESPERLEIGRIGKPHGMRGDVTVMLVTDRAERTEPGAVLYTDDRELVVESARRQRDGWVVRFHGVDDRDGAEALRGAVLHADPLATEPDELWAHDLIGCEVRDLSDRVLGTVAAVEANPAHDLLVLDGGALVPLPFVVERRGRTVLVDPPEGLFE
jgi:16S rRNA processing protein RimM